MNRKLLCSILLAFVTPACVGVTVDGDPQFDELGDGNSGGSGGLNVGTGGSLSNTGGLSANGASTASGGTSTGGVGSSGGAAATGGAGTGGTTPSGGAAATGGAGTGGSAPDPSGCIPMATGTDDSGSIGLDAICFTLSAAPPVGWQVNNLGSRTMSVNGTQVSSGQAFPGSAPFVVEFTAGEPEYTSWSFW